MMILGGDWKQLLPIVKMTYGKDILDYTLKRSPIWSDFKVGNQSSFLSRNKDLDSSSKEKHASGSWSSTICEVS